jgi:hypothetical protein
MQKELFKVEGHLTPSIFISSIDGKHYIVPNWIEVPLGTKLDQVVFTKILPNIEQWDVVAQIKAKRGNTMYDILRSGNKIQCSCSKKKGCAHIKDYFDNLGIKILTK